VAIHGGSVTIAAVSDGAWTVRKLLEWTAPFFTRKGVEPARLNAELLLAHVLTIPRIKLYMDIDRVLDPAALAAFRELVRRAGEQEPVAYLTGRAHFFNLELDITRDVLIPRPDTEVLVEQAIRIARSKPDWANPRVLDLCTGSGCVAAAIAANLKTSGVVAVDISSAAIAVAQRNIQKLNLAERVVCLEGDLYAALTVNPAGGHRAIALGISPSPGTPGEGRGEGFQADGTASANEKRPSPCPSPRVPGEGTKEDPAKCDGRAGGPDAGPYHLILANPPYILSEQIATLEKSVREYEPLLALDGGADGLSVLNRIWADAAKHLVEEGQVLSEIAFDQGPAALAALADHSSLKDGQIFKDYAGRDRVIAATKK